MWLLRQPEHHGYDILSPTATWKVHWAGPTTVHSICRRKAFDTVGRTGLWQLLRKYGCREKSTTMTEALHTGMMANVSVGGEVSESFSVTNGVKQGCLLAISLAPTALLQLPINNTRRGFPRHGGWRLHTVQTERWPIQRRTLQSEDQDYSDYMNKWLGATRWPRTTHNGRIVCGFVHLCSEWIINYSLSSRQLDRIF